MNFYLCRGLTPVSKFFYSMFLLVVTTSPTLGQAFQGHWNYPQHPAQRSQLHLPQASQYNSPPIFENLPPGATTRVLPDGRVAIVTPFTEAQKQEVKQREADRIRIRKIRTREFFEQGDNDGLYPRLPGEFEKPKAILLSICDWQPHNYGVLIDLIEKTRGHAELLLLFNDKNQSNALDQPNSHDPLSELIKQLLLTGQEYPHLRFLNSNLDSIWLRDFGPRLAETKGGKAMVMDFFYDTIRPKDDEFPKLWAGVTGAAHNLVPWSIQGGNMLANGRGLAIATSRIYEDNRIERPGKDYLQNEAYVKQQLMRFCNIRQLVVLKPLEQETTRHVDMFATFLSSDLVLVAKLDPRFDPVNARILDHNAQSLSQTRIDDGRPLRVERIWIPPRRHQHWSSYTNIILTDRLALIPTYQSDSPAYIQEAIKKYRRLLPQHTVKTIDMTSMDRLGGSLHCLSCSIPSFAELPPGILTFREAAAHFDLQAINGEFRGMLENQPR